MADNETIADIIAEIRTLSNPISDGIIAINGKSIADRLEAAHKRERGDCAKLREAVKHIKDRLPHMLQYMRVHWEDANAGGYFDELMLVIDAALAAPPRNCERFGSSTQARAEWYKTEVLPRVEGVVSGVEPPFVDWLFAPATEKEGGAK